MKLGLKKGSTFYAWVIRQRLASRWSHSAVMIDGIVYQATAKYKVSTELQNPEEFDWYDIGGDDYVYLQRAKKRLGKHYDWFSLLAFIPFVKARNADSDYCFEFCYFVMTGNNPSDKITPEVLLLECLKNESRN
jgi:hypothetical protein